MRDRTDQKLVPYIWAESMVCKGKKFNNNELLSSRCCGTGPGHASWLWTLAEHLALASPQPKGGQGNSEENINLCLHFLIVETIFKQPRVAKQYGVRGTEKSFLFHSFLLLLPKWHNFTLSRSTHGKGFGPFQPRNQFPFRWLGDLLTQINYTVPRFMYGKAFSVSK